MPTTEDLDLVAAYDYTLPERLIATSPASTRSESRLLVFTDRGRDHMQLDHRQFSELPNYLKAGDLLIRNSVRVLPARVLGRKATGGQIELLIIEPTDRGWNDRGPTLFRALSRSSKRIKVGGTVAVNGQTLFEVVELEPDGNVIARTSVDISLRELLETHGQIPLPPYIVNERRDRSEPALTEADSRRYQTVYAQEPGAVAAPTAGLHFTEELLLELSQGGVDIADIRLDVGIGTFRPLTEERVDRIQLHRERYAIPEATAEAINSARRERRRIIAVGTTAFRALEDQARRGQATGGEFDTTLFVHPGVPIHWVDGLITNFHLPRSSLLTLVCAFGGYERVMAGYREAVERSYRFYSYGDATLLFRACS